MPMRQRALDHRQSYTTVPLAYSTTGEPANWWVVIDHCYARNWRPENTFLRPTKTLFITKPVVRRSQNPLAPLLHSDNDDFIDVDDVVEPPPVIYDRQRAKELMEGCERHAALSRTTDSADDWEDNVSKQNWSPTQHRLFNGIVTILNSHYLGCLSYADSHNEAICRRTIIDKSVERVRKLFATIAWDSRFTQWLHHLLIEKLTLHYLTIYLDILQTLKSKLPAFVDKFMVTPTSSKLNMLSYESLFPLLKSAWDPIGSTLEKSKKLPGNPILIALHALPLNHANRVSQWISLLSNLAPVVTVGTSYESSGQKISMTAYVDQLYVAARCKIQEVRAEYPGRSIALIGFGSGASLALQIAQIEQVICVCAIGFSLMTADGKRGDPDDSLLELQCPVLFVIGQCSATSFQEDMEDLRARMRVETGLIIVGAADDHLRINKKMKRQEGITQTIVDRCIADEIADFIGGIIMSPFPPQVRQSPTNLASDNTKKKNERKRYSSNTSSLDSEPPSPTAPRIPRPVGRPPGSKSRNKLSAQGILSSSNSSPQNCNHNTNSNTNDTTTTEANEITPLKKLKTLKPIIPIINNTPIVTTKSTPPVKKRILSGKTHKMTYVDTGLPKTVLANQFPMKPAPIVLFPEGGRIVTSKKQLLTNKNPIMSQTPQILIRKPSEATNTLLSPSSLTTQDIMDLPIIFADDNQLINTTNQSSPSATTPKLITTNSPNGKVLLINKSIQLSSANNFILSPKTSSSPITKFTKVIVSAKLPSTPIVGLPSEISIKKVEKLGEDNIQQDTVDQKEQILPSTPKITKLEDFLIVPNQNS